MLSCVSPSIQPADLRASDACAQLVTDTQVQTVLELSGRNFGTNTSYLSVLLSNGTLYVETRCTVFLDFALRRGGIAESLIHRAPPPFDVSSAYQVIRMHSLLLAAHSRPMYDQSQSIIHVQPGHQC